MLTSRKFKAFLDQRYFHGTANGVHVLWQQQHDGWEADLSEVESEWIGDI